NLAEVAKALQKLKDDLGEPSDDKSRARAKKNARDGSERDRGANARGGGGAGGGGDRNAGGDRADGADRDADGWPPDLPTDPFLKGAAADDSAPLWGYDPDEVAAPKAR